MNTKAYLHWEVTEKVFKEKISNPQWLFDTLQPREMIEFMVVTEDKGTVQEVVVYKSQEKELYVSEGRVLKKLLNTIKKPKLLNEN